LAAFADGLRERDARAVAAVDEVDEHEAVVDHDAGERDHAEHREDREVQAHREVAEQGADEAEGNGGHGEERLGLGAERNREQHVDPEQREEEAAREAAEGLSLLLLLAASESGISTPSGVRTRRSSSDASVRRSASGRRTITLTSSRPRWMRCASSP
jgi:hypothetical protein